MKLCLATANHSYLLKQNIWKLSFKKTHFIPNISDFIDYHNWNRFRNDYSRAQRFKGWYGYKNEPGK